MVREAELEETEAGLVPRSAGWFVLNARDARRFDKPGQGHSLPLTGNDEHEAETFFPMLGMAIRVMKPGEVGTTYHWETEQEDFLVLAGEAIAVIEGQERALKQWDFVHCPPETKHAFVGAGAGPWGSYCFDETAAKHNAASPDDTKDGSIAYGRFPPSRATRYPGDLLP